MSFYSDSRDAQESLDAQTVTIENISYRWAYLFLSFGLLGLVAYRGFVNNESAWDLMGLVILGGIVCAVHQWCHKVLTAPRVAIVLLTMVVAGVIAALLAWLR